MTTTSEMTLPQVRALVEGIQAIVDEYTGKVEERAAILYAKKAATLIEVSSELEYWGGMEANLRNYKRRTTRRLNEASLDYWEKFNDRVRHGGRGRLAAGSAWGEREAAANSEYIVEWKKYELLKGVLRELEEGIKVIETYAASFKFNRQADLRSQARGERYASALDHQTEN